MGDFATIQLFCDGAWHEVAQVALVGDEHEGWRARTTTGYDSAWAIAHAGARDARALCSQLPVGIQPSHKPNWPVFLIDLLAQGYGREELLKRIELDPRVDEAGDWPLLKVGAGNAIGNLRVKEAAEWLHRQPSALRGFTQDEVAERGNTFAEYLAAHGLFLAGSSGVQGEWPKVLLTKADDGLLYLDHTLPDARAREHYLVKFGRGKDPDLALILRHEAPYMAIAQHLGLRVHGPLELKKRALFIPRFDRVVADGNVVRLGQESIATLTDKNGFRVLPTHDEVCEALLVRCTAPEAEVLEYIKRDVANIALRNTDNHARNTAIQRDFAGGVRLTPLFDFAPMYKHPDGIARRIKWTTDVENMGRPDWGHVVDRVCLLEQQLRVIRNRKGVEIGMREPIIRRQVLVEGLRTMGPLMEAAAASLPDFGIESSERAFLQTSMRDQAAQLQRLR